MRAARLWVLTAWAGVLCLLYAAFKDTPAAEIARVLSRLNLTQAALLLVVNLAFLLVVNVRWAVLLRSLGQRVPLSDLILYRLAGFGVSYFTPGPQFGGEPLQVHLLHRRSGVPLGVAVSSVLLDRLVDLLANFTFLFIGSFVVLMGGLLAGWQGSALRLTAFALFLLPAAHLLAISRNRLPLTWLIGRAGLHLPVLLRAQHLVRQAEEQAAGLVRTKPLTLMGMMGLSMLAWGIAVLEFWLCLRFLGVTAGAVETISALTAARLSILLPLPGGLGALEAGQSLAAQFLGWGPAAGLALGMLIRARDVTLALTGLGLGGYLYRFFLFRSRIDKDKPEVVSG